MCSSQLSLSLISRIYIPMDSNLTKVCPQCNSRAVCKCGYAFPSKRKAQSGNAMKHKRVHKASVRASETSQKTLCRQEMGRVRRAGKRASETPAAISQCSCGHNFFCNTLNEYLFISLGFSHSPSLHLLND